MDNGQDYSKVNDDYLLFESTCKSMALEGRAGRPHNFTC